MIQITHFAAGGFPVAQFGLIALVIALYACLASPANAGSMEKHWQIGAPIVTYWAGPPMTEATAKQIADGNWNLVWCRENELDVAQKYGLRALLHDSLLKPAALNNPDEKAKLDALISRVKNHPAMYAYYLRDEPNVATMKELAPLAEYLTKQDPAHTWYINLFPIYASNKQLGTVGDPIPAYQEHLDKYVQIEHGKVTVDSESLPILSQKAKITMSDLSFVEGSVPVILYS